MRLYNNGRLYVKKYNLSVQFLLTSAKCVVHKSKPSVCTLFPIGRFLQAGDAEGNIKDISVEDVQYIFSSPGCGDNAESHTVREWLGHCGIPIEDEFFIKWQKVATMELQAISISCATLPTLWNIAT